MQAAAFDKIKVFANVGGEVAFLLANKGNYSTVLANDSIASGTNIKLNGVSKAVPFNAGWHVGVSGEYELQNGSAAFIGFLYRNNIIDATTPKLNNQGYRFSDGNIRQNSFAIRIGYYF